VTARYASEFVPFLVGLRTFQDPEHEDLDLKPDITLTTLFFVKILDPLELNF
jgi:hypothetical protein